MDTLRHLQTLTLLLVVLLTIGSSSSHPMDPIDKCILICDRCFKGDTLLNCANHCIFSSGTVDPIWKITCPLFDDTPRVHQV